MQKASSHPAHSKPAFLFSDEDRRFKMTRHPVPDLGSEWAGLLHIVCNRLQVLFHSPNRGSFHLSLAVLVHYRSPRSI
jgi:hypothetical protein